MAPKKPKPKPQPPKPPGLSLEDMSKVIEAAEDKDTTTARVQQVIHFINAIRSSMPPVIWVELIHWLKTNDWIPKDTNPSQSKFYKNLKGRGRTSKTLSFPMWAVIAAIWPTNSHVNEISADMSCYWGVGFPRTDPFFPPCKDMPIQDVKNKFFGITPLLPAATLKASTLQDISENTPKKNTSEKSTLSDSKSRKPSGQTKRKLGDTSFDAATKRQIQRQRRAAGVRSGEHAADSEEELNADLDDEEDAASAKAPPRRCPERILPELGDDKAYVDLLEEHNVLSKCLQEKSQELNLQSQKILDMQLFISSLLGLKDQQGSNLDITPPYTKTLGLESAVPYVKDIPQLNSTNPLEFLKGVIQELQKTKDENSKLLQDNLKLKDKCTRLEKDADNLRNEYNDEMTEHGKT
ncbi:hypothetical protein FBEOM_3631 [Fusarium beomiforme]|uniref:Uncharacterized protein n=1 Tax=Fusarium beomiforme TaxID=44412 RepID=A0A9P5APA1_9HYPO|nr:hypothetical protein FBEOM_3631 [Fusarium beomiforme]